MTTGSITPSAGQEVSFERLVQDTVREAQKMVPMDKEGMQRLLGNGGKFRTEVISLLAKYSVFDDRFDLIRSFELTVPRNYNHCTQLATFAKYAKTESEKFLDYCPGVTDRNYANVTKRLVPGKTYGVKMFGTKTQVTSEECLRFLGSQKALLVGAQGVSMVRQLKKNEFPVGKWTASFDEKSALWVDSIGSSRIPGISRTSHGGWGFQLFGMQRDWDETLCMLCFIEL